MPFVSGLLSLPVICDKWQSKTLFLTNFDLPSPIVLTFSIAAYPVCSPSKVDVHNTSIKQSDDFSGSCMALHKFNIKRGFYISVHVSLNSM